MRVKSDSFLLYCLHSLDECIYYYYIIIMIVVGSVASSSNEAKSINPHSHCNPLAGWTSYYTPPVAEWRYNLLLLLLIMMGGCGVFNWTNVGGGYEMI